MPIPPFFLGTFGMKGSDGRRAILQALECGFRALDTGQVYDNESEIGHAVVESAIPRDQLFIATNIAVDNMAPDRLLASLDRSRDDLQTDCIDLTLIHWPVVRGDATICRALEALALARQRGLTRAIGVSNFTIALMHQAVDLLGPGAIATNQIEIHPYFQNRKVVESATALGIHTTSFKTLAKGRIASDPTIQRIAQRLQATPAQVVLAWALALGHSTVTSSLRREHLALNLRAAALRLDAEAMADMAGLERHERLTNPAALAPAWD